MKIIRFLSAGREQLGRLYDDGHVSLLEGNLFTTADLRDTGTTATVDKLLAPFGPRDILCIGLNYKEHAAESGAALPRLWILSATSPSGFAMPCPGTSGATGSGRAVHGSQRVPGRVAFWT